MTNTQVTIRTAKPSDLQDIVRVIADDTLGGHPDRADGDLAPYREAFDKIDRDDRNELFVADLDGAVVGTFQNTYIPHMFDCGRERALIEAIFVAADCRGKGIGSAMLKFALERARERGCALAELHSNKARGDAHRFYEAAGFKCTHEGFKAVL